MSARGPSFMIAAGLALALCAVGCGGGGSGSSTSSTASQASATSTTSTTTSSSSTTSTKPDTFIEVTSPALPSEPSKEKKLIPARYTCHGQNTWPTISWKYVPSDAKELALFILHEGGKVNPVDWAVLGLKPTLTGIQSGKLPIGAIVGRNTHHEARYSVCPPKSHSKEYVIVILALTRHIVAHPGFDGPEAFLDAEKRAKFGDLLFY